MAMASKPWNIVSILKKTDYHAKIEVPYNIMSDILIRATSDRIIMKFEVAS